MECVLEGLGKYDEVRGLCWIISTPPSESLGKSGTPLRRQEEQPE